MSLAVGTRLGPYEVTSLIGKGVQGIVHLHTDSVNTIRLATLSRTDTPAHIHDAHPFVLDR